MKWFAFALSLLILVVTLVACGGDDDPTPTPTAPPAAVVAQSTATPAPAAAAGGDATRGQQVFSTTCAACHGPAGEGIQGLGKDMTHSEFIAALSDEELLAFVKVGRRIDDPLNTTKVDMPPKGGNPALSDEQLIDIIAFIRSIHKL